MAQSRRPILSREQLLSRLEQLEAEIRWLEDFAEVLTIGVGRRASDRYVCDPAVQGQALESLQRLQAERTALYAALDRMLEDGRGAEHRT